LSIYLKPIDENNDLVSRIVFLRSDLALDYSMSQDLGFGCKPYEREWRKIMEREKRGGKIS
jgi:hypothetical protein